MNQGLAKMAWAASARYGLTTQARRACDSGRQDPRQPALPGAILGGTPDSAEASARRAVFRAAQSEIKTELPF